MREKTYDFKIAALTLNQGKAYDDRRNPVSQTERWGLFLMNVN